MDDSSQKEQIQEFLNKMNWQQLLQQNNITKEYIITQIKESNLDNLFLSKEYSDGRILYIQSTQLGLSIQFENDILNSIYIYGKNNKTFSEYKGELPYLINLNETTNGDIVAFLGEPSQKQGGQITSISISYEYLGIEFTFNTKTWTAKDSYIDFLCLFQKNTDQKFKKCGSCTKQTSNLCSRCCLVYYCSGECQKSHFKIHKDKCKLYSSQVLKK